MALTTLDPNTALVVVDGRPEAHDYYSIKNVFPKLGETASAQEIIELLETRGI